MQEDEPIEVMARGKFVQLLKKGRWEYAERVSTSGGVMIVALTKNEELLLVEQYRVPMKARVLELPAGLAGDIAGAEGEDFAIAAHRELLEETGYEAGKMERLTSGPTSPGLANEVVTIFLATDLNRVHDGGGDRHEDIDLHAIPLAKVPAWLETKARDGIYVEPRIYAGLFFAARHLEQSG